MQAYIKYRKDGTISSIDIPGVMTMNVTTQNDNKVNGTLVMSMISDDPVSEEVEGE